MELVNVEVVQNAEKDHWILNFSLKAKNETLITMSVSFRAGISARTVHRVLRAAATSVPVDIEKVLEEDG